MEIREERPSAATHEPARADSEDGPGKSDLGRGTDRERAVPKIPHSSISANGPQVPKSLPAAHPTAEWTIQQFSEFLAFGHPCHFVIHDRDGIFSPRLDAELKSFGVRVLKTPVRAPKANAFCERLIGTIRRERLDFLIPLSEAHLKRILREFMRHFNRGRPYSLGPGIPEPSQAKVPAGPHRHKLPTG